MHNIDTAVTTASITAKVSALPLFPEKKTTIMTKPASCRMAMDKLEILLKSYNRSSSFVDSLFHDTFDPEIRMELNGRSYKGDFLAYQIERNFDRGLQVEDIVMEVLDNESFHYTYQLVDYYTSSEENQLCIFHSFATVKDGKIIKIKPMTGSAYNQLFEYNIYSDKEEDDENERIVQQTQKKKKRLSDKICTALVLSSKRRSASRKSSGTALECESTSVTNFHCFAPAVSRLFNFCRTSESNKSHKNII